MSKILKGATDVAKDSLKLALTKMISDIVNEIMQDSGVKDITKDKLIAMGFDAIKKLNLDPKNIQRDLVKNAIMKELNLK